MGRYQLGRQLTYPEVALLVGVLEDAHGRVPRPRSAMTRAGLAATVVTLGVVLLLSLVAVRMQSLDFQEHSRYEAGLVHLKELDARQNADVLESRFELATSYDSLVDGSRQSEADRKRAAQRARVCGSRCTR